VLFALLCADRTFTSIVASVLMFFFTSSPTTPIYTLSLHDALPISAADRDRAAIAEGGDFARQHGERWTGELARDAFALEQVEERSEEHTSELQSPYDLVCRLLLEKKNR